MHNSIPLFLCPHCKGAAVIDGTRCTFCHGNAAYGWHAERVLFFGRGLRHADIAVATFRAVIRGITNGLLIAWGVAGLTLVALAFLGFLHHTNDLALFFWSSILTDCFAYRRLVRESEEYSEVPHKVFGQEEVRATAPTDWSSADATPQEKKFDIAKAMTPEALHAIRRAVHIAERLHHREVAPVHLFGSLLSSRSIGIVFGRLGISVSSVTNKLKHYLSLCARGTSSLPGEVWYHILFAAYTQAVATRRRRIDVTELLAALARDGDTCEQIFFDLECGGDKIANAIAWIALQQNMQRDWRAFRKKARQKPRGEVDRAMTAIATPLLDRVSHDVTRLARNGYVASCVGRDKEIEEVLRAIESGRQSVLLVGNPGTGKSAIMEGIALRMVEEDVPAVLFDKRLVSVSIPALLSGAAQTGELEDRLSQLMAEVVRAGNVVLFIDNVHELIGVTTTSGAAFDLSQVLTSLLEKHAFVAIAATTPADYKHYCEKNGAFGVVFQQVRIDEMDVAQTILVLESKAGGVEYKNCVYFSYDAIEKTATLAKNYIADRYLPDKAVKVLEEVAVYTRKKNGRNAMVTGEDVAELISEKTKIPVTKVGVTEKEKLLHLEEAMHGRIIGQDEAVSVVASALRRARTGLRDVKRPIANFLFLGPTGVGKTELAKTLAEVYFADEQNMIRLDMSEYQEKSAVDRLLGTTAGEGGYLADAVRKNPFSLVLLDEIEKTHPDILNVFLQVMDDARMTDGQGRTIDFTNTIIIATSNAGSQFIHDAVGKGTAMAVVKERLLNEQLREYFRPEFLNRFDAMVVFKPLVFTEIVAITKLLLQKVGKRLEEKGIVFSASPEAVTELAKAGFDPVFGARPLKRVVQEKVDDAIANALLKGEVGRGDRLMFEKGGVMRVVKK